MIISASRSVFPAAATTRRASGMSLVELMIALALGSMVTAGVIQLFVANSQTHNLLIGQSRMQESARFALEFLSRSVRVAGYRGCFSSSEEPYSMIRPTTAIPYEFDIRFGIQGYDGMDVDQNDTPFTNTPLTHPVQANLSVPNSPAGGADVNVLVLPSGYGEGNGVDHALVIRGTDVLTLRNLSAANARVVAQVPVTGPFSFQDPQPSPANLEFDDDHLVMIHDCQKGTIFRVTGVPVRNSPVAGQSTISHAITDFEPWRNAEERLAKLKAFENDSSVSAIETNVFFIAPGEGVNSDGNKGLSLWQKVSMKQPVELVEGVEDMQVLYGIDLDSDRVPNRYVTADAVIDWREVVTLRVSVVVNSVDNVGATALPIHGCEITYRDAGDNLVTTNVCVGGDGGEAYDGLLRRAFSQTIQMRNHG